MKNYTINWINDIMTVALGNERSDVQPKTTLGEYDNVEREFSRSDIQGRTFIDINTRSHWKPR